MSEESETTAIDHLQGHAIFCIDGDGAYSRAIPCAERSAVFHTL
jgi:hypothetical protein